MGFLRGSEWACWLVGQMLCVGVRLVGQMLFFGSSAEEIVWLIGWFPLLIDCLDGFSFGRMLFPLVLDGLAVARGERWHRPAPAYHQRRPC